MTTGKVFLPSRTDGLDESKNLTILLNAGVEKYVLEDEFSELQKQITMTKKKNIYLHY